MLYIPAVPRMEHAVADVPRLHGTEPDALPDSSTDTPTTGPPIADVTLIMTASGRGHGGIAQSGWVS
jgi:hypothetical protein